jgi:hypothetical protein
MDIKDIEERIKDLENQVRTLKDIEAIKKLQRSYGYYLEHWMYEEVIDCFSDSPEAELNILVGVYLGKEGVRRYFSGEKDRSVNPELLHQVMQLSGIVDIDPDGNTAGGRWYGFGAIAIPTGEGVMQRFMAGIYNCKYIKEKGIWKILKLIWNPTYLCPPEEGWVSPERLAKTTASIGEAPRPDKRRQVDTRYPSGYITPFHYRHPVSGKETSEGKRNASLSFKRPELI